MHACRFLQRHISDHRSVTHTRGISQESRFERQLRPLLSANDGSKRTARAILCADVLRADESRSTRLVYAQWRGGGEEWRERNRCKNGRVNNTMFAM